MPERIDLRRLSRVLISLFAFPSHYLIMVLSGNLFLQALELSGIGLGLNQNDFSKRAFSHPGVSISEA